MNPALLATLVHNQLWYLLPLVVVVSLVYGATRHELTGPILHHAFKAGIWILGFMGIVFVVLLFVSWNL
jgi:hypothetical protein